LKKKWYLVLVLFLVGAVLYIKLEREKNGSQKTTQYIVKKENLKETLSLSGKIDASESATLRFQTSGMLTWVGVKEGDYVKKYQTIASLDQRELKKQLEKDLNTYTKTRWTFEQTKDDNNAIITTSIKRILDKSQYDLNNSVIDVELQNLSLQFSNLWSPIEGIVARIQSPLPGVNITPATAEFQIINPNSIYFSALADQVDVVKIQSVDRGEIVFDSYPDQPVAGKIISISFIPKSGETGIVYETKISLPTSGTGHKYRMGMTGDVSFVIKQKQNTLAIPASYIKSGEGKKYVLKKEENTKVKTFIILGDEYDGMVEVEKGLSENDIIY